MSFVSLRVLRAAHPCATHDYKDAIMKNRTPLSLALAFALHAHQAAAQTPAQCEDIAGGNFHCGDSSSVGGTSDTAVGAIASATGGNSTALGRSATANAPESTAIGMQSVATG